MDTIDELIDRYADKLRRALDHLEYSHRKVQSLSASPSKLDDETLETWESYTARFSRVVDLFATKYLRAVMTREDPAFEGSLRDVLDAAEKKGLIESTEDWIEFRKLRNTTAHEYEDQDIEAFFERLRTVAPKVLQIRSVIGRK